MPREELHTSFSFDETARSGGSHAVAASIASYYADDPATGEIVIVLSPDGDQPQVVAGGTESALRAAISTAVSAGHRRLWDGAPDDGSTAPWDLLALPENVRAATDGAGVNEARIGIVRIDDTTHSFALWLDLGHGMVGEPDRGQVMQLLGAAAERDREHAKAQAAVQAERRANLVAQQAVETPADPMERLLERDAFEDVLDEFEGDEAVLVLFDVDEYDELQAADDGPDDVVRSVTERLVANCRASDVVARLDDSQFAVLLGQAERGAAMTIVKRVHDQLASPDESGGAISATVAFAHQDGLLDLEELLESAERAIASSRRSGPGRLVLAS